jgi:hypothetical protein
VLRKGQLRLATVVGLQILRAELAARLFKLVGVGAGAKKEGGADVWHIEVVTNKRAAGRKEFRDVIAEIVWRAVKSGWADAMEKWLEKTGW